MSDKVTLERIELLHPAVREEAKQIYAEICERLTGRAICRFAYTLRTFAEQDAIYAKGRTVEGVIVTNAKAGQSWHNYGLAVDVVLIVDGKEASYDFAKDFDGDGSPDWQEIDFVFSLYGWVGLYNKKKERYDLPHFQKTFGLTIAEALSRHNSGQVLANTNYIKLYNVAS